MHGQCKACWQHQILVNDSNTKVILDDVFLTIYSREKQIDRKAYNLCLTRSGCVTELLLHVDGDHCRKKTNRIKACDWIMAAVHRWFPTLFKRGKEIPNHTQRFPQNDWNQIKHTISSKLQTTSRQEKNYLHSLSPTPAQRANPSFYTHLSLQCLSSDFGSFLPIPVMVLWLDQSLLFLEMTCKQHTLVPTYWSIVWLHCIIWRH